MSLEKYIDLLSDSGFRITEQRLAILQVLMDNQHRHLTNDDIHDLVRSTYPEIGLATVYRTTQVLSNLGIITTLNIGDGKERYEMRSTTGEHNHHHLICTECGGVSEFTEDLLDDLEDRITKEYGFSIADHELKFIGICSDCQEKLKNE